MDFQNEEPSGFGASRGMIQARIAAERRIGHDTMSDSRHARVKEIFLAVTNAPPHERHALLEREAKGDAALFGEVASLLEFHEADQSPNAVPTERLRSKGPQSDRFAAGETYADRYRIVSLLGRGGMGEVFRAYDLLLREPIAVKLVKGSSFHGNAGALNEVRLARRITHPNVCRVFDVGQAGEEYFITMEYVDGENLRSLLDRIGRLPPDKVLDVARQLACGLAAAHAKGILHRDMKPENIMIDGRGIVRITDFGIATAFKSDAPSDVIIGTPAYMAPEQLNGGAVSERSDLYSLALVLHELLTGQPVYGLKRLFDEEHLYRPAPISRVSERIADVDPALDRLLARALDPDPDRRPVSALAFASELPGADALAIALEAGATPPRELVARSGRRAAASPAVLASVGAAIITLLFGAYFVADRAYSPLLGDYSRSPDYLAERTREILRSLGYNKPPGDTAFGYWNDDPSTKLPRSSYFWYRQSPESLAPVEFESVLRLAGRVTWEDPPRDDTPGEIFLLLDSQGQLRKLTAVSDSPPKPGAPPTDWEPVLKAGGWTTRDVETVPVKSTPVVYVDSLTAWRVKKPVALGAKLEITAGGAGGRVVNLATEEINRTAPEESRIGNVFSEWGWKFDHFVFLIPALLVPLAISNLKRGRTDRRGTARLMAVVLIARAIEWILVAQHSLSLYSETTLVTSRLAAMVLETLLFGASYAALEPMARRYWPQSMVAWSRVLEGRLIDPEVGRSLLAGSLAGTFWSIVVSLDFLIAEWLGNFPDDHGLITRQLWVATRARNLFGVVPRRFILAMYAGLLALLLFVIVRQLLRNSHAAAIAFTGVILFREALSGFDPTWSWLVLGIGIAATSTFVFVRFGLLAFVIGLAVRWLLCGCPMTFDLSAWYAPSGIFGVTVTLGLAALGVRALWFPRAVTRVSTSGQTRLAP